MNKKTVFGAAAAVVCVAVALVFLLRPKHVEEILPIVCVDIGTLVGPGAQSLLANVVKSDTVLVEFKMTDLDYQKSKARTRENLALVGLYKALGGGWN